MPRWNEIFASLLLAFACSSKKEGGSLEALPKREIRDIYGVYSLCIIQDAESFPKRYRLCTLFPTRDASNRLVWLDFRSSYWDISGYQNPPWGQQDRIDVKVTEQDRSGYDTQGIPDHAELIQLIESKPLLPGEDSFFEIPLTSNPGIDAFSVNELPYRFNGKTFQCSSDGLCQQLMSFLRTNDPKLCSLLISMRLPADPSQPLLLEAISEYSCN